MWLISRPKWVPTLVNLYCTARRLKDNWQGWVYTDREEREREDVVEQLQPGG